MRINLWTFHAQQVLLRIPMRGYELNLVLSALTAKTLRIPMRGYEKISIVQHIRRRCVTNPHEGL